jgi:hypothetical protein
MKTSPDTIKRIAGRDIRLCHAGPCGLSGAIAHGASMPFQFVYVTERAQACLPITRTNIP